MSTWKIFLILALVGILFIVVLQNTAMVTLQFLFWQVSASRIILFAVTLALGVLLGFFLAKINKY